MPEISIPDFDKVDLLPPRLDPGTYVVNIQNEPEYKVHNNGKNYLDIEFVVIEGPNQAQPDPNTGSVAATGKKIHDWLWMVDGAYFKVKQMLIAMGLLTRDDKTSPLAQGKFTTAALVGARGTIKVSKQLNAQDQKEYTKVEYVF